MRFKTPYKNLGCLVLAMCFSPGAHANEQNALENSPPPILSSASSTSLPPSADPSPPPTSQSPARPVPRSASPRPPKTSPSLVGWTNTFVPGAGEAILGHYSVAGAEFVFEVGTFLVGYHLSAKVPLTLDGVPESIPSPHIGTFPGRNTSQCTRRNSRGVCIRTGSLAPGQLPGVTHQTNITKALEADFFQEIGIKTHFVDVFDAYRKAGARGYVDRSPISELFMAPFDSANLTDPYVYGALLVSLGFHAYSYQNETVLPTAPLDAASNTGYGAVYGVVYPTGSAAPEEMFYRGFVQNELLRSTHSPYVAVPLGAALYTFSHSPDSYTSAATSGLFLGALAYRNHGALKKNIAFHFWSDVIMGVHAILSLQRNERPSQAALSGAALSKPVELVHLNFEF